MTEESLAQIREMLRPMAANQTSKYDLARYDTSDILQEALTQIWMAYRDQKMSLEDLKKTWLWQVIKGHAAKLHRFHHAMRRSPKKQSELDEYSAVEKNDPAFLVQNGEQLSRLMLAVDSLEAMDKKVVFEYYFEDKTLTQVAESTGNTVDIIRGILKRSKEQLCRMLE